MARTRTHRGTGMARAARARTRDSKGSRGRLFVLLTPSPSLIMAGIRDPPTPRGILFRTPALFAAARRKAGKRDEATGSRKWEVGNSKLDIRAESLIPNRLYLTPDS